MGTGLFKKISFFALIILVMSAAGCGSGEKETAGEKSEGIKTYTIADDTGDWGYPSPFGHYARGPGYVRMSMIFDTLVWKDQDDYVPALAEEWNFNEEENVYTFKLRDDVTWHDGEEFNAKDVVFTFNYIKEQPYAFTNVQTVENVVADGEYKVKFHLQEPYAPFLSNVVGTVPIMPEHIYKDIENPGEFRGEKALTGTGPFKLEDYSKSHGTYLYKAYEDYYGGKPLVDELKFVKVSNEMSASALKQGEVNIARVPPETVEGLKGTELDIMKGSYQWNAKIMFNHRESVFKDKKFRQAVAYAVDREEIVEIALRGHGKAASPGMIPQDSRWYNPQVKKYEYNPEKAASILNELGYTENKDGMMAKDGAVLELELLTSPRFSREAGIIKEQLEKAGIKVATRSMEAKTVDSRVENWEFDFALSGHGGLGGDPEILNKMILSKSFNSVRFDNNEELNKLLNEQIYTMDTDKRKQLVNEIQEIYAEELPALSLYYPVWYWGHDGKISYYFTREGIALGVPLPFNKLCFVE